MKNTFEKMNMTNVFDEKMDEVPATRTPGNRTIDHVLATRGCYDQIEKCGLVAQDRVFLTDHMGLFVDIKMSW